MQLLTIAVNLANFTLPYWCTYPVYIWQSLDGGCDGGPVACTPVQNTNPWAVEAGSTWSHSWTNGATSLKIGTTTPSDNGLGKIGILQFEYKLAPASPPTPQVLYWDLSDLDGVGGGLVGSPFHNENVKATPYNNGTGLNGCHQIRCPQGKLCRAAYDTPNDVDTRVSLFFSF